MATFDIEQQAPLAKALFDAPAPTVAQALLGHVLLHTTADGTTAGIIVETEAYDPTDPASHSFRGRTARTAPMFDIGGTCYVYRSYGIHWCINVATGPIGHGAAVLLRALEPIAGLLLMAQRRGRQSPCDYASGSGRLTQAMAITDAHNHHDLTLGPLRFVHGPAPVSPLHIIAGPRVGITQAQAVPWRFCIIGNRFVSHPRPR